MKAKEIQIEQGSADWLALRKNYIGSSDASCIMGVSKWDTEYSLWCKKLDLVPEKQENSAMRRGKDLEPIARDLISKQIGVKFMPGVFVKDFQIASLDGICQNNEFMVEIKCPGKDDHDCALKLNVPAHYYPQLQHQLMVMDLKEMFYMSYTSESSVHFIVNRDDAYCEKLLYKELQFWKYLETLENPPLVDRDYESKDGHIWNTTTNELSSIRKELIRYHLLKEREEELKKILILESGGKNCIGNGFKLSRSYRKGPVEYSKIPEMKDVNTNNFRKPKIEIWRLGEI